MVPNLIVSFLGGPFSPPMFSSATETWSRLELVASFPANFSEHFFRKTAQIFSAGFTSCQGSRKSELKNKYQNQTISSGTPSEAYLNSASESTRKKYCHLKDNDISTI